MDLDLLAESDTDNESVHGGSVHSVGGYDNAGGQGSNSRNNNNQASNNEGESFLLCVCLTLLCTVTISFKNLVGAIFVLLTSSTFVATL